VNGGTLTVDFDQYLDGASQPAPAAFTVKVNGATVTPASISVAAAQVTVTLLAPVRHADAVTIAYAQPVSSQLKNLAGTLVGGWSATTATNSTANVAPTAPTYVRPAAGLKLNTATPALSATFEDDDTQDTGTVEFEVCTTSDCSGSVVGSSFFSTAGTAVGGTGTASVPGALGLADATSYWWRARSVDAGTLASAWTTPRAFTVDSTAPVAGTPTVNGATLTIPYGEALDTGSTPATTAFAVTVNGGARTVDAVSVSGSSVLLTLNPAAHYRDTVSVAYTVPGSDKLRDTARDVADAAAGNLAAALPDTGATNLTSSIAPSTPSLTLPAAGLRLNTAFPNLSATFADSDPADDGKVTFELCADSGCATPRPPAARLARVSPALAMRARL